MKDMGRERRFVAVDQGNSLLKLTLFAGDEPAEGCRFASSSLEEVFSVIERWKPDCGAFCTVGKLDSRLVESLRIVLDGHLLIMSRTTRLPIGIKYTTRETLGLDRIALACGAAQMYKGETVAVVDSGTAVTLDIVDRTPTFRGGRITAGVRLRLDALHSRTSALPLVDPSGPLPIAGDSTETAIRSGVVRGLADEITETYREYKETYGCSHLALTGGDAGLLIGCIKSRIPADHVPDLMARGLLHIYNHNEI